MKVKCDFCDNYFEDTESSCPYCGGANTAAGNHRFSNGVPKTIDELKLWAVQNNVPLAEMRVYIGDNNHSPRCIGIYREGKDVTVYKNKSDGTRAVRYQGSDEAYAVNEVYLKIKEMMAMAAATKRTPDNRSSDTSYSGYSDRQSSNRSGYNRQNNAGGVIALIVIVIMLLVAFPSCAKDIGRIVQSYSTSNYSWDYNPGYGSGYGYNYDYDDDSDDSWDSDWDSDYGDYDWDFDYDWDSDW